MAGRAATLRVGWWSCLSAREWWFACGLLIVALVGPVRAERPALTPLLKLLDLRSYAPGTMAPAFTGRTLDARRLSSAELRGKVIVLNFWASWCLECRSEAPVLERIHREFAPKGLAVIAINTREDRVAVQRYAKDLGLTFPLVLDPDGKINAAYGVIGLPTTLVLGRDGRAVALAVGPREWASAPAQAIIEALLAEPAPSAGTR
jgi:cytochrome c biogenesis protein CcmG, thiol:disulfide interchange protein DsbE